MTYLRQNASARWPPTARTVELVENSFRRRGHGPAEDVTASRGRSCRQRGKRHARSGWSHRRRDRQLPQRGRPPPAAGRVARAPAARAARAARRRSSRTTTCRSLSWLVLRGRCRHCSARDLGALPAVELTHGARVRRRVAGAGRSTTSLLARAALRGGAVAVAAIDLEHRIIPNRIVAAGRRLRRWWWAPWSTRRELPELLIAGAGGVPVPAAGRARLPGGDGDGGRQAGRGDGPVPRAVRGPGAVRGVPRRDASWGSS